MFLIRGGDKRQRLREDTLALAQEVAGDFVEDNYISLLLEEVLTARFALWNVVLSGVGAQAYYQNNWQASVVSLKVSH